ncbi:hypothetical protein HK097_007561 [Rhizophlyctis rosea]|uniref:Uncharacterized protein n=1 Tax=Rhizophlyctis rosea TaxID=64517 RepID=A0AAD5SDN1_9FUNG|nr:hypothetical protein HK097_007561 [Rhizophlyctis rosea]
MLEKIGSPANLKGYQDLKPEDKQKIDVLLRKGHEQPAATPSQAPLPTPTPNQQLPIPPRPKPIIPPRPSIPLPKTASIMGDQAIAQTVGDQEQNASDGRAPEQTTSEQSPTDVAINTPEVRPMQDSTSSRLQRRRSEGDIVQVLNRKRNTEFLKLYFCDWRLQKTESKRRKLEDELKRLRASSLPPAVPNHNDADFASASGDLYDSNNPFPGYKSACLDDVIIQKDYDAEAYSSDYDGETYDRERLHDPWDGEGVLSAEELNEDVQYHEDPLTTSPAQDYRFLNADNIGNQNHGSSRASLVSAWPLEGVANADTNPQLSSTEEPETGSQMSNTSANRDAFNTVLDYLESW